MSDKITVGLPWMGSNLWTFGNVYQNDLIRTIQKECQGKYRFVMMVPKEQANTIGEPLPEVTYSIYNDYKIQFTADPIGLLFNGMAYIFGRRKALNAFVKTEGIDVVFGPYLGDQISTAKTMTWIPDFQHVHFPDMFSSDERLSRSNTIRKVAAVSDLVILISESAKEDYCAFVPEYKSKARVFTPLPYIDDSIYASDPATIARQYNLPEKFMFLPNQFWKHKNHSIIVRALKLLKDRGVSVTVVCAGNSHDYRNPAFFSGLMKSVSEAGLRNQFIYIGLIPKTDVSALIRQSVCVINPSMFEGHGFTVDEARSIGKTTILSNLAPHIEQNPPKAHYFKYWETENLAQVMASVWNELSAGPDPILEREAKVTYQSRSKTTAETFGKIIEEVLQ